MPPQSYLPINVFIIYISLPAVALLYIPHIIFTTQVLIPLSVGGLVFLGAAVLFGVLWKMQYIDRSTFVCLLLTCGLGNTSFLGFPLTLSYYGEAGLSIAIIADQGTFLVLATFGVAIAIFFAEGQWQFQKLSKRILTFPPFIAFILALILPKNFFTISVTKVLEGLSAPLIPLALFSVGLQLQIRLEKTQLKVLSLGLLYKLLLAPLFIWFLWFYLLGDRSLYTQVTIFEAAMPPMITAAILASQYNHRPKLAQLLVSVGLLFSFLTAWFWWWLTQ
mgnify:CR=1 FL=1